jgi:endonuclease YncB( thermonuclease family)
MSRLSLTVFEIMRWPILILAMFAISPSFAANSAVRDAGTIDVGGVTYRLGGIDAPAADQVCINEQADSWACGAEARDQLTSMIGDHDVHCDDLGPDTSYTKWHIGICTAGNDTTSLNQLLVRRGLAINAVSAGQSRFGEDETDAKSNRRGLWKGCFIAPHEFRIGRKDGSLIGSACRADKDREIRTVLFPQNPAMPSGCGIKGKFALRARVTGNVGIYHLPACRSYPALTNPDRWFCSEDDARAAGFRKAYNCRPFSRQRS